MSNKRVLQIAKKELTKAKAPSKPKDIIYDPMGQWRFPGQETRIPSGDITMQGVPYPVYAQPNVGQPQMMYPGQEYSFPGADYVDEYPQMRKGGDFQKYQFLPANYGKKKYSSNISATNRLFAKNFLFRKEKNKIYNPNAKFAEGGSSKIECDPGFWFDESVGTCVPIKKRILIEDENDPRYQDYLIKKKLYEHSQMQNFPSKKHALTFYANNSRTPLSEKESIISEQLNKWKEKKEYTDDTYGPYGSKTNKQNLSPEEFNKWVEENNVSISSKAKTNDFYKKYPPKGYEVYETESDFPNQLMFTKKDERIITKPQTDYLEDKFNRAKLKEVYPDLTDSQIDKWVTDVRTKPEYITNTFNDRGHRNWIYGPGENVKTVTDDGETIEWVPKKYPDFNPPTSITDSNSGVMGYYPDYIHEDFSKKRSYTPIWGEPEEAYDLKLPGLEPKKPGLISIPKGTIQGSVSENLPPEYQVPDYKKTGPVLSLEEGKTRHYKGLGIETNGRRINRTKYYNLPKLELYKDVEKDKLIPSLTQKLTGYDPKYMEGYTDEEGNEIPGEIQKAKEEDRRIEFKGRSSRKDKKAQEEYNKAYDAYEDKKRYYENLLSKNRFDDGGITDAMNAMMKARLAYANEFGNPAAKRMINLPDNPYQFDNGDTGTHYMASMDNYAVPQIQDENGQLMLGDYGPESNEAMRFDTDEDAAYFAEHYKDVSPGFIETELTDDEIQAYRDGGYIVEDISVPSLNQKQDGGENNFYKVKGSKGVYRKVDGKWEVDWDKTGNFQQLSKGDVKKRSEQLNKNAKPLFDQNYNDLITSQNAKYTAAPKAEPKKKLSKSQAAAQDIFTKDFKTIGKDKLAKAEDKIEKGVQDFIKYHNQNFDTPLTKEDIDNARQKISNNVWASEGVYNPSAGEYLNNISTISNQDSKYNMSTAFPKNASAGDYAQRGWEYLTNPLTAAEYSISGGGAGNMPFNINELRMKGIDPGVVEGRNIVGNTLNATTNLFDAGDKVVRNIGEGNYGTAALEAIRFLPVAGYADDIAKFVSKSKNVTKPAVNTVAEIAEAPARIVAPPSIPQRPTTSAQVISNRFDELSNTYDALTARAKLIDEFGMEDVQRAFSNQYSQPSHSGSINLRRSGNNQLPPPPPEITIDPSITGTNFRQRSLEDDMQSVINEINLNVNHPEYRIEDSYDDLLNTLTTNPRYTPEDIERVRNNNRYRTAFTDLKNQQRSFADYQNAVANRNTSSSPFSSSAQEYISGSYRPSEQNINVSNRYADKINKIAAQILRPQEFLTLNNAVVGSPAKTAAKKLSKKFNTAKDLVKETLEKANVNIGKLIDKSKIESLKDPIKPKDIDAEVNKLLESGLGVKKGDIKIKVNTKSNGQTQVLLQPYEFFKNNKKLIEDVYGEGTFDEWIKTIDKDAWIDSGYLGLGSTSGEMLKPRTFTEILSGKKAKPTIDFGSYGNVEIPTPGLKRAGDFPFEKWDYNFRQNILDNLGVSGEISQAYKKALQSKGYNIYSGGTGHLMPGAKRYVRELLNNRVEVMNPKAAEDLITLLNDPNVLRDVNASLKNKNVPLPEVVRNAINPIVFKYKKKGGQIQNYFELDLTPEEIEDYRKQGYIIEDVD